MEFLNYYIDVSKIVNDRETEVGEKKENQDFIDDTEIKNDPSDYYGL